MSDLREALDHILILCNKTDHYTRRLQTIHEVAMKGLGLTAGQPQARHERILERTGGAEALAKYHARQGKRRLKAAAKEAEKLAA